MDLRETLGPNDEWYDLKSIVGDERVFIARGTVIENAIGTSSNDALQGNATANHLEGGGGLDALNGDAGDDTLEGGANSDTYLFTGAFGNDTIIDSDADGELVIDNKIYWGTAALSGSYEVTEASDLTFPRPIRK